MSKSLLFKLDDGIQKQNLPKYVLYGYVEPTEDWDLDCHVARVYFSFEEMLYDVRKLIISPKMILPFTKSLQYPISLPWFSPHPTDPRATPEALVNWIIKNIDKTGRRHLADFYLDPQDPRSICQLFLLKHDKDRDTKITLPDKYAKGLD